MILDSVMEMLSIVKTLKYKWVIRSQAPKDICLRRRFNDQRIDQRVGLK